MKKLKLVLITCLISLSMVGHALAATVYCTNCSTTFTQMLDRVTNLEQLAQMAEDYKESVIQTAQQIALVQKSIEQYANMVQNTISLPETILNQAKGDLMRLAQITTSLKTKRGDVAAMTQIFNQVYPALDALGNIISDPAQQIDDLWKNWSQATDQAAETVFQLTGQQLEDMAQNGEQLNSHINKLLATPEGQMQALQAANNLSSLQIQEMRQLRELIATSLQASTIAQMKDEKKEQLAKELWQEMHKTDKLGKQYEGYE